MLDFQHAADALLLGQQRLRHSRFARMHMLFLDAVGAADGVVLLRWQHCVVPNQDRRNLLVLQASRAILRQTAIQFTYDDYYLYQGTALARI